MKKNSEWGGGGVDRQAGRLSIIQDQLRRSTVNNYHQLLLFSNNHLHYISHLFNAILFFQKYSENYNEFILNGSKDYIIEALHFLLKDPATHKKRAYLAPYLAAVEIPNEYSHEDGKARIGFMMHIFIHPALFLFEVIVDLVRQLEELQDQFKNAHKYVEGIRQPGEEEAKQGNVCKVLIILMRKARPLSP